MKVMNKEDSNFSFWKRWDLFCIGIMWLFFWSLVQAETVPSISAPSTIPTSYGWFMYAGSSPPPEPLIVFNNPIYASVSDACVAGTFHNPYILQQNSDVAYSCRWGYQYQNYANTNYVVFCKQGIGVGYSLSGGYASSGYAYNACTDLSCSNNPRTCSTGPSQKTCPSVPSGETAFTLDSGGLTCSRPGLAPKNKGPSCINNPAAAIAGQQQIACTNPINTGTGNKYQSEVDYLGDGPYPLRIARVYNSSATSVASLGSNWRGYYDRSIILNSKNVISTAALKRNDSKQYYFNLVNGVWVGDGDVVGTLTQLFDTTVTPAISIGWTYVNEYSEIETYNAAGQLTAITNPAGLTQTLTYSCTPVSATCPAATPTSIAPIAGLLITVADSVGRQLNFDYDSASRITTITVPTGGAYTYAYSDATATANLSSVTYPDTMVRTYLYGETANVSATPAAAVSYTHSLTGITDENSTRYASWTYDAQGRATSSEHGALGSGIEKVSLVYSAVSGTGSSTTTVTDPLNTSRTYNFQTILGAVKNNGITGQPCNGCSAVFTYDANGNVASRTDFNGNKTTYAYDLARNLEVSRTEGLTAAGATITGVTRTLVTSWHPTWRLPTLVTEYAGATASGTALKRTTYSYDDHANLTQRSETDPANNLTRTTSISYTYSTTVPGLMLSKVINGPRTDVNDVTTYTYYPETETDLGKRGNLASITDALGHVTQYTSYNAHGQLLSSTDANGLVTTNTYDQRQRLTARTIGTETTSMQYDGVGQVTQLTLPDSSSLSYSYDAAHRLTQITDNLGNSIRYTLDAMGNRTKEDVKDPSGSLSKTLTRSYDALNRLQTLTGVGQE